MNRHFLRRTNKAVISVDLRRDNYYTEIAANLNRGMVDLNSCRCTHDGPCVCGGIKIASVGSDLGFQERFRTSTASYSVDTVEERTAALRDKASPIAGLRYSANTSIGELDPGIRTKMLRGVFILSDNAIHRRQFHTFSEVYTLDLKVYETGMYDEIIYK